ncbi:hypothetical protein Tco_0676397 [Tanacetum coccineum]
MQRSQKGKELLGPNGGSGGKFEGGLGGNVRSYGGNGRRGCSITGRGGGSLAKCSMESKDGLGGGGFVVLGGRSSSESKKDCLDGWVGAGGEEVKGGGVNFGVRLCLVRFLEKLWGKVAVKYLGLMEEPFDNRWVVIEDDREGTPIKGWRNNKDKN